MKVKFQTKVIGAFERFEISKAAFAAAGWEMNNGLPSYRWTKGNRQVRCDTHGWVLIVADDLSEVLAGAVRKGKFVVAKTQGEPQELLDRVVAKDKITLPPKDHSTPRVRRADLLGQPRHEWQTPEERHIWPKYSDSEVDDLLSEMDEA